MNLTTLTTANHRLSLKGTAAFLFWEAAVLLCYSMVGWSKYTKSTQKEPSLVYFFRFYLTTTVLP